MSKKVKSLHADPRAHAELEQAMEAFAAARVRLEQARRAVAQQHRAAARRWLDSFCGAVPDNDNAHPCIPVDAGH